MSLNTANNLKNSKKSDTTQIPSKKNKPQINLQECINEINDIGNEYISDDDNNNDNNNKIFMNKDKINEILKKKTEEKKLISEANK